MAEKKGKKGRIDAAFLDELDAIDAQDMKDLANLDAVAKSAKSTIGLKKSTEEKADKREIYLLTATEQKNLNDYCHNNGLKKSSLIRKLLRDNGMLEDPNQEEGSG